MSTFRGYDTDLLISLKAHGRALVGDDALYEAAQEYTDPATGGGIFGPALREIGPQRRVPAALLDVENGTDHAGLPTPTPVMSPVEHASAELRGEEEDAYPWDAFDLITLRDILKANNVDYPRTMTKGGAIKRLEAANIPLPT